VPKLNFEIILLMALLFFCGCVVGLNNQPEVSPKVALDCKLYESLAIQGCENAANNVHHQLLMCEREIHYLQDKERGW